ncbi:MAG: hypothetical protein ACXWL2_02145 [Candidatus Chromulinivorax sp.]
MKTIFIFLFFIAMNIQAGYYQKANDNNQQKLLRTAQQKAKQINNQQARQRQYSYKPPITFKKQNHPTVNGKPFKPISMKSLSDQDVARRKLPSMWNVGQSLKNEGLVIESLSLIEMLKLDILA